VESGEWLGGELGAEAKGTLGGGLDTNPHTYRPKTNISLIRKYNNDLFHNYLCPWHRKWKGSNG
jgi:hypothetical protein